MDLTKFDVRELLCQFEGETIHYDADGFFLNEATEKIWSYVITLEKERYTVVFQLTDSANTLSISFQTEHSAYALREQASRMAHVLKKGALSSGEWKSVVLESPLILDLDLYKAIREGRGLTAIKERTVEGCRLLLQSLNGQNTEAVRLQLYGAEGFFLAAVLEQAGLGRISDREEDRCCVNIELSDAVGTEEVLVFLRGIGFAVDEVRKGEAYDIKRVQELFSAGLIDLI